MSSACRWFSTVWWRPNTLSMYIFFHPGQDLWAKTQPDSWASHLSLCACLIHQVKRGADHLDFIDAQVAESFVVPFWRPSPVARKANKPRCDCSMDSSLEGENTWGPLPPEVHPRDVREPGPPRHAGFEEVLRLQHHPSHCCHARAVVMVNGHAHQRTRASAQVCAPRSVQGEYKKGLQLIFVLTVNYNYFSD